MQVQEQVPLAKAEIYLFTWKGHLCFLPGLPWFRIGSWRLPEVRLFRPPHLPDSALSANRCAVIQQQGGPWQQPWQHLFARAPLIVRADKDLSSC